MTRTNEVMTSANLTWLQVLHFRFESALCLRPDLMLMDLSKFGLRRRPILRIELSPNYLFKKPEPLLSTKNATAPTEAGRIKPCLLFFGRTAKRSIFCASPPDSAASMHPGAWVARSQDTETRLHQPSRCDDSFIWLAV